MQIPVFSLRLELNDLLWGPELDYIECKVSLISFQTGVPWGAAYAEEHLLPNASFLNQKDAMRLFFTKKKVSGQSPRIWHLHCS